jgi:hypothetical protein
MVSARQTRVFRLGNSVVVVLPRDWVRGNGIEPGDSLRLSYNGLVRIYPHHDNAASGAGASSPSLPAQRPAHGAETDEGGLADAGT